MAELAALGVAASVLQVVDYGTRFLTTLYQVRRSKHDFLNNLQTLHSSSDNLRDAQHELQIICHSGSNTGAAISSLAKKSEAIAKEMLDSLKRIEENSHGRKRDAVIKTWLIILKEDKLKSLESRLTEVKADLTFYLSVNLRATARETLENQMQMLLEMRDMRADIKAMGDASSASEIQAGFGSLAMEYLTGGLHERQKLKSEFTDALIARIHHSEAKALSDSSSIQLSPQRRQHLEQIFISRIRYDTIQERELTIKEAHKGTFRWIFNDNNAETSPIGFKEWLVSDGSLYWITGKPGSGKSTLMKYLLQPVDESSNANRCNEYLQQWAGDRKLTIASFHFWAIGSDIQASKEGLLRTLLVQLFRAHPDVIPLVASSRWESLCLFNEDPRRLSLDELGDMFRQAIKHISTRAKLALFIDGLDEFDGDCNALISLIQKCIASPIKVCVSSRPWTEFENAFGYYPRLKMEDLTYDDITKYVVSKFKANTQFARFQKLHPQFAGALSHSIADKASGVFLWVTIVVASLLAGMMAGDRVEDLKNRLNLLPSEMDELYGRIIDSIDPLYREHAAQLFKLVYACNGTTSLRILCYRSDPNQEFLCLAAVLCVGEYIGAKADRRGLVVIAKRDPKERLKLGALGWRLQGNPELLKVPLLSLVRLTDTRSASVIKLLLDKGAKPNEVIKQIGFRRTTAWEELLAGAIAIVERSSKEEDSQVTECVHLMLEKGAKVTVGTVQRAIKISKECEVPRHLTWMPVNQHQYASVRRNKE
ncbi:Vegetative incompatibility protein HET-E-1 [Fusarium odoratissimum]|uniref:Vegetative incompatibility protein HET-E-1 n=1 Tax=Fusarium oxysporum f. sp. cubense (strain race 4) TaxID=2502994 RepID=N1RU46_FUSC4|nr:Vegetative incompatibility protein HET-E-1 [Fusarium odoratissimum]